MQRCLILPLIVVLLATIDVQSALAQAGSAAAPVASNPNDAAWPASDATFARGPGGYLSTFKILLAWVIFALWVKTADWASQDCSRCRLNYALWNPIIVFSFVLVFVLHWLIPWFWLSFVLLLIGWIAPFATYVVMRNKTVLEHQKVFTPSHLKHVWAGVAAKFGLKVETEQKSSADAGPPVKFVARGGATEQVDQANLLLARQSPGFVFAKELVADVLNRRGDGAMLDFTQASVAVKYQIDGVWHDLPPKDRPTGDPLLAVLKRIGGKNEAERRLKQEGTFGIEYQGQKYDARLVSQGVETGERAILFIEDKRVLFKTFAEIGLRQKLIDQLKEKLGEQQGLILLSAMPAGGLSTLFNVTLRESDRYMRDFASIEEATKREREVENVHVHTYSTAAGETPMTKLPDIVRTYPNVYVIRDLFDAATTNTLLEQIPEERLILASIRAKETVEALLRVLMLKVAAKDLAPAVICVVNVRLIRKLCESCKEAYAPPPEIVRQLGPAGAKIEALYRPPSNIPAPNEKPKPPCEKCQGIGYLGRTGLFEVLMMDDTVRQTLIANPKLEALRAVARKAGMRNMQEEGILLVARGVTSLPELMRVLKL